MTYLEQIDAIISKITLIDFSSPRDIAHIPSQVSSNFIINKEQGDWAENLIMRAINGNAQNHIAVKYGKSDDLIAGDPGFESFFNEFQKEMDTIGKRPDVLIFRKADFDPALGADISHISHERIGGYVKKAIAGLEIRSSSFLIDKYETKMQERTEQATETALEIKDRILKEYADLLNNPTRKPYINILNGLNENTLGVADFKVPGWRSTERLSELNDLLKQLKNEIKDIQKRDYLSITPKVEDLKVVYKWIQTFGVPHFYFQVFFDKVYGMSFKGVLETISNPDNEGPTFLVEGDVKNQKKMVIKIRSKAGAEIACKVDEPNHKSVRKELERGRLIFYVKFDGGEACLNVEELKKLLNIEGQF